jgi:hypothetical protein
MAGAPLRRKPSTNKEADVEETIGYEALFSGEEWDAIQTGDWTLVDEEEVGLEFPGSSFGDKDGASHEVTVYEQGASFDAECEICGSVGIADSAEEAEAIKRLHEAFVATLVEKWTVTR